MIKFNINYVVHLTVKSLIISWQNKILISSVLLRIVSLLNRSGNELIALGYYPSVN